MGRIKKLPYPVRLLSHGARLPSYISFFEAKATQHDQLIADLNHQIQGLQEELDNTNKLLTAYQKLDNKITDLAHQISTSTSNTNVASEIKAVNSTVSDNHRYDQFYKAFEDKFRGSEDLIKNRLLDHLPLFQKLPKKLQKKPIVDIGCGRGELLSVLKDNGYAGVGIDMNESMVKRAVEMGFEAYNTDALSYLQGIESNSLAAVTGFHIVEHIPFEPLMEIFNECYRTVDHGGFVLFETPNPETASVGSHTFYLDPSHLRPVPPQLLEFMLGYVGFDCKVIRLHPISVLPKSVKSTHLHKLYSALFGPADYAIVARKV